jgi:hypothetical protein
MDKACNIHMEGEKCIRNLKRKDYFVRRMRIILKLILDRQCAIVQTGLTNNVVLPSKSKNDHIFKYGSNSDKLRTCSRDFSCMYCVECYLRYIFSEIGDRCSTSAFDSHSVGCRGGLCCSAEGICVEKTTPFGA